MVLGTGWFPAPAVDDISVIAGMEIEDWMLARVLQTDERRAEHGASGWETEGERGTSDRDCVTCITHGWVKGQGVEEGAGRVWERTACVSPLGPCMIEFCDQ